MKKRNFLLFLLSALWACSPKIVPSKAENLSLRVMSYNVHHCNPPKKAGVIDVEAIANVIKRENPDLVALQEIDVNTNRSGKINQAALLAEKTGMYFYFGKAIAYDGGDYGVAILSKYPISSFNVYALPNDGAPKSEPRVLSTVMVSLPGNRVIRFGSTHLDAQKSAANRLMQINEIKKIASRDRLPFILAGDFNDTPGSEVIDILDSHFRRTCLTDCGFTIPEVNPTKTIDFIAYAPARKMEVTVHKVVQEHFASDHLPVVSVLTFNK